MAGQSDRGARTVRAPSAVAAHLWALIAAGATDADLEAAIERAFGGAAGALPPAGRERVSRVMIKLARAEYAAALARDEGGE